jgi:hypothetical protein
MWDNGNRVLHETEHSVARDLQIRQITDEFDTGPAGLAPAAKVLFRRGLPSLLRQQPAYQTAWLIRIQAARARAERRAGQRPEQQRDTFNPERARDYQQLRCYLFILRDATMFAKKVTSEF